ncbi:MAG: tetratricopeptide repeat protein [Patescibacteria group bacterium]
MKIVIDLIAKANALMEKNLHDDAEPLLIVAIKHDANNPEVHYLLGEVYCKQKRFKKSVSTLRHADSLLSNNPRILHLLGWALFMNGDVDEGRLFMTRSLKIDPHDVRLLCDFAVLETRAQDYLQAREYARTAMSLDPNDDVVIEVNAFVNHMYELKKSIPQKN